jgi:hypothetical protein
MVWQLEHGWVYLSFPFDKKKYIVKNQIHFNVTTDTVYEIDFIYKMIRFLKFYYKTRLV